jgi:histidyl-tRNA synthetase
MAPRFQAPRGTRDLLPEDLGRWRWAEAQARGVLERYGYGEIRTPLFEDFELFARTSGESSDVVQKEMYRFKDLGDRDLALRPEFTAGVMRAFLERGLGGRARIHRLWSTGPVFRYGRPQKGRYRQFSQVNCELVGSPAPGADVEMITLFVDLYEAWGFRDLTVVLNSVGQPASRRAYGDRLRAWLAPVHERLSDDSRLRLVGNPLRVLDTKDEGDLALFRELGEVPHMLDAIDEADRAHWEAVLAGLDAAGVVYEVDHGLVRGLDYYTRTAFEVHDRSLGAQSALGGGGRYDGLIAELGGPPTPGVGFAIGLDRAMLVLEERGAAAPAPQAGVYLAAMEATQGAALALARELRRRFPVEFDVEARGFGAQMKAAGRSGARLLVIVGEDEWKRGEVVVKDLASGTQETIVRAGLAEALGARLAQAPPPALGGAKGTEKP